MYLKLRWAVAGDRRWENPDRRAERRLRRRKGEERRKRRRSEEEVQKEPTGLLQEEEEVRGRPEAQAEMKQGA